jgi:hypothetical protein
MIDHGNDDDDDVVAAAREASEGWFSTYYDF